MLTQNNLLILMIEHRLETSATPAPIPNLWLTSIPATEKSSYFLHLLLLHCHLLYQIVRYHIHNILGVVSRIFLTASAEYIMYANQGHGLYSLSASWTFGPEFICSIVPTETERRPMRVVMASRLKWREPALYRVYCLFLFFNI